MLTVCLRATRRQVGRHRDLALAVQPVDRGRPRPFAERHDVAKPRPLPLDDGTVSRAIDVRRARETILGLQDDLVLVLAAALNVVTVLAGDQRVERLRDVLHAHAEVGGALVAVDLDAQLRLSGHVACVSDVDQRLASFSSFASSLSR